MITFRYKAESLGDKHHTIDRPIADVFLKTTKNKWIEFHPYIDSGADVTIIPLSLGKLLGLRLNEKNVQQIGGIRGSVPIIYVTLTLKIGQQEFPCHCAWSLIEDVPPLLGRTDVFDQFNIHFRQNQQLIEFTPTS